MPGGVGARKVSPGPAVARPPPRRATWRAGLGSARGARDPPCLRPRSGLRGGAGASCPARGAQRGPAGGETSPTPGGRAQGASGRTAARPRVPRLSGRPASTRLRPTRPGGFGRFPGARRGPEGGGGTVREPGAGRRGSGRRGPRAGPRFHRTGAPRGRLRRAGDRASAFWADGRSRATRLKGRSRERFSARSGVVLGAPRGRDPRAAGTDWGQRGRPV